MILHWAIQPLAVLLCPNIPSAPLLPAQFMFISKTAEVFSVCLDKRYIHLKLKGPGLG